MRICGGRANGGVMWVESLLLEGVVTAAAAAFMKSK